MQFKLLKKYDNPYKTIHPGIIYPAKIWANIMHIDEKDIEDGRFTDWFLSIDDSKYLKIDLINIEKLFNNYPNLLYTIQIDFPNLEITDIRKIASYVIKICHNCHDSIGFKCHCVRDE